MPVSIKFDPHVTMPQVAVIQNATSKNDGVMTKEQAAQLAALVGGGTADGTVGGVALAFTDNALQQSVMCGKFWPQPPTNLGPCRWEAWLQPGFVGEDGGGIILVDSFGGDHAILLEMQLSAGPGSLIRLGGNMRFDAGDISFTSYDGLWAGEPGHIALIYDMAGAMIYLFVNGLCSQAIPTVGNRQSQAVIGGPLALGSFGHVGYKGLIQQVRGWDSVATDPVTLPKVGVGYQIFALGPQSIFPAIPDDGAGANGVPCQFLMNLSVPSPSPPDLSPDGFLDTLHSGTLFNLADPTVFVNGYPRPQYVAAPLFPGALVAAPVAQPIIKPPATKAVPAGCKVFDGYTHGWNTMAWDKALPQLPPTQGGSLGPLPYAIQKICTFGVDQGAPWGTDNSGNAVCMSESRAVALIDIGTADMDVRISRIGPAAPQFLNGETGFAFRAQDQHNFWYLQCVYDPFAGNAMSIWLLSVVNGADVTILIETPTPNDTFTTIRCLVVGTTFQAFIDDGAGGWIQVGATQVGQVLYQNETKLGPFQTAANGGITGQTTMRRYTDLTVF